LKFKTFGNDFSPYKLNALLIIDKKLKDVGYVLQDYAEFNPYACLGVAVREFPTNNGGEVDYAIFMA